MDFTKLAPKPDRPPYRQDGAVRHLDASVLTRPFDPPKSIAVACIVGAVVAAVIGGMLASKAIDQVLHGAERKAATVEENINRGVTYDLPPLAHYISLDDEGIRAALTEAGYELFDRTEEGGMLDIMKLPSDTTVADAAVAYAMGTMDAVTASKYLVGAWELTCDREEGIDLSVKYADLQSADAAAAIQSALDSEGWTMPEGVELQTDSVGNTYVEGTMTTDMGDCSWRVAACPLEDVYDIDGLPETAQYVGIRLTYVG